MTTTSPCLPAAVTAPRRLSQRYPLRFPLAVRAHRVRRRMAWLRSDAVWAERVRGPARVPGEEARVAAHA